MLLFQFLDGFPTTNVAGMSEAQRPGNEAHKKEHSK
jgi:hypothetical protein